MMLRLFIATYIFAALTTMTLLYAMDIVRCSHDRAPFTYIVLGAAWPIMGAVQIVKIVATGTPLIAGFCTAKHEGMSV